jgi:hypothetical protein
LTVGQRAMFALAWLEYEKGLAKERQKASGGDRTSKASKGKGILPNTNEAVVVTLPQSSSKKPEPKSRERVASKAGIGQSAVDKAARITEYAPDIAEDVTQGRIDLEPAYREARKVERAQKARPVETVPPKRAPCGFYPPGAGIFSG